MNWVWMLEDDAAVQPLHLHHSPPDLRHHLAVVKALQQAESVASS